MSTKSAKFRLFIAAFGEWSVNYFTWRSVKILYVKINHCHDTAFSWDLGIWRWWRFRFTIKLLCLRIQMSAFVLVFVSITVQIWIGRSYKFQQRNHINVLSQSQSASFSNCSTYGYQTLDNNQGDPRCCCSVLDPGLDWNPEIDGRKICPVCHNKLAFRI